MRWKVHNQDDDRTITKFLLIPRVMRKGSSRGVSTDLNKEGRWLEKATYRQWYNHGVWRNLHWVDDDNKEGE